MENKKGAHANAVNTPNNEALINEAVPKHVHQHNTAPQHLRLLQYSLNIPTQLSQSSPHPPVTSHVHQHLHQSPGYQPPPHQHLQPQHQHQSSTPTIYQNQVIHYHQRQQPQKNQNHFHYQSNQVVALTCPNLNQLNQQNAQIWTPHQAGHYHPQQQSQNKPEPQSQAHPLPHKDVERKKSAGSNQQLRSPSAKRPPEAPVAIQGWLHKQGSEGLMLWKKRWFVLSEYCLFYYKGPEEEKLLGSILLPSYKVSVCGPEDKVNRKWAFKCEHANMRTYILAADSQELMIQWVRLLNMACLLQSTNEIEQEKKSNKLTESSSVKQKPSPQIQNLRSTPVHMYTSSNTTDLSNPSQHELSQYSQPLYANAPPKPRRLTDGYSSPSSEMLDRYSADSKYMVYQQPYQARPLTKSPINVYGNPQALNEYVVQQPLYNKHLQLSEYGTVMLRENHSMERRTPDTYGRSKQNPKGSHPSDYEDVYADRSVYKRPLSPLAYNSNSNPVPALALVRSPMVAKDAVPHQSLKAPNTIPRPHSADFLDYEIKHHHNLSILAKQPRPKSSLDINRNSSNDNYFYSEERYAEKMRKSVQYLPKMMKYQQEYPAQQRWPGSSYKPETENTFPLVRSNSRPVNFNEANVQGFYLRDPQPLRSRSVLSDGSLSKEVDMDLQPSHYDKDPCNPAFRTRPKEMYHGYNEDLRSPNPDYDHFTRSASARLAQSANPFEERSVHQEGERKREESMKRLLEWKQRMLQSPLNRKVNQNCRGNPGKANAYQRSHENRNMVMYRESRKPPNALPQYNSYSSDDEENEDGSKETVQTQAGRTTDTYPSISDPHIPALIASATVFNPQPKLGELLHAPQNHDSIEKLPVVCTHSKEKDENGQESEVLEKPLKIATNNSTHTALVSSLRSEFSNKFEKSLSVTEIKSNGALVKNILAEFEKKTTSEKQEKLERVEETGNITEENYMTMTPKKSILDPSASRLSLTEVDENPYVEMSQTTDASLSNNDQSNINELQAYETICFSDGKLEPVYVELNLLAAEKQSVFDNSKNVNTELPDILIASQDKKKACSSKSDSSDADDEASKDLDSLEIPCHPRFSLSDTFRPASYYLGGNRTAPEQPDSSDSELVSPPPIPTSPPPLEGLDNADESFNRDKDPNYNSNESSTPLNSKKHAALSFSSLIDHDNSSFYSINTDVDKRFDSRLSHTSDSDVELRVSSRTSDYERMLKRRPVSEEFYNEWELSTNNYRGKCDEERNGNSQSFHDYENMYVTSRIDHFEAVKSEKLHRASCSPLISSHSRDNSKDTINSQMTVATYKSDSSMFSSNDFVLRTRPESSASITAEVGGFLRSASPLAARAASSVSFQEINSAPYFYLENKSHQPNFSNQPAPYYYSDLSINTSRTGSASSILTLNNQRSAISGSKRDITHIVNPIRCNNQSRGRGYPQHSLFDATSKLAAEARSVSADFLNIADKSGNIDKKNIYESDTLKRLKTGQLKAEVRKLYSTKDGKFSRSDDGGDRNVRRSYSLEGLLENVLNESIPAPREFNGHADDQAENTTPNESGEGSHVWEEDSIWRERLRSASQRHTRSLDDLDAIEETKTRPKKQSRGITRLVTYVNDNMFNMPIQEKKEGNSFTIDREKLRQWDFLSSAPSDAPLPVQGCINSVVDSGAGVSACDSSEQNTAQRSASGSISINTRDTFPRTMTTAKVWPANTKSVPSKSTINLAKPYGTEHASSQPVYLKPQSQQDLSSDTSQSSSIRKAKLPKMDAAKRLENLHKLEQIKQHLLELEKQYEKGKPLVNLVDNMVKLGSLYRFPKDHNNYSYVKDRIEFNQHIQERRLLAEERRDWNRLSPNHTELQAKVQQLYQLDHLIQEESEMLQGLQHDKEEIERALGGLRYRLIKGFKDPAEVEQARKQQIMLENELSRVHSMLAQNSRKLEETVAGNARLEQELLVLKQKLQISRQQRSSPQISNAGDSLPCVIGTSAMLESDLHRVQQKVGDLQRQRQELSMQVRQLTDRSSSSQQSRPSSTTPVQVNHAAKKKMNLLWRETDLDTMNSVDHGEIWDNRIASPSPKQSHESEFYDQSYKHCDSGSEYDTFQNQSAVPQEKQEIKTVRIVKRESERRQRDREKTATGKWDTVIEEEDSSQNSSVLFRPMPILKTQSSNNLEALSPAEEDKSNSAVLSRHSSISNPNLPQVYTDSKNISSSVEGSLNKSPELSPIFKSEAARQIIIEMSSQDVPKQSNRRAVPKEKRRHYTAPHNNLIMKSLNQLPTDSKDFDKLDINNMRRARDDLDMERALRQRIDAPDVVRSTLSNKELKYNESTIDNILGTPNKIFIPERYVPEQLPQLSAEEQQQRLRKVESIKKMLSDTTIISGSSANLVSEEANPDNTTIGITNKATSKMIEEKKQREHLLQLNQILAKQVMEMSKIVAVKALASLPLESDKLCSDEDDFSSPETPLPIYQQRDNFYS